LKIGLLVFFKVNKLVRPQYTGKITNKQYCPYWPIYPPELEREGIGGGIYVIARPGKKEKERKLDSV